MRKLVLFFVLLFLNAAHAEVQSFPEQGFQVQFADTDWKVASQDPEVVTFVLGNPPRVLFAVALAPRPKNWEQLTSEQRQEKAQAALEKSSDLRVASLKEREYLGHPGTLMYLVGVDQDRRHTEGFSLVFTTDQQTYLLTALAPAGNEDLLKTEFAAAMASFQLLEGASEEEAVLQEK